MKTRNTPITKTFTVGGEVVERTVTVVETTDYDERGNEIHRNLCDGYEVWREFDERGNQTYSRNSQGFEIWWEYDANGNKIHSKDSDGGRKSRVCSAQAPRVGKISIEIKKWIC